MKPDIGSVWKDELDGSRWKVVGVDSTWVWVKRVLYGAAAKSAANHSVATHPSYFSGKYWQKLN